MLSTFQTYKRFSNNLVIVLTEVKVRLYFTENYIKYFLNQACLEKRLLLSKYHITKYSHIQIHCTI
jgi:hypothetical protein